MKPRRHCWSWIVVIALAYSVFCAAASLRAETMLQYFNTSWDEITAKMPELAEAGYDSIWIPPPTKGGGALSVGYDLFDPFDLGSKDQKGTVATYYGTEADLLRLVETAHRFGIRVYLDNVMNHRGFDVPGYSASTPIDFYPGMLPEDFSSPDHRGRLLPQLAGHQRLQRPVPGLEPEHVQPHGHRPGGRAP